MFVVGCVSAEKGRKSFCRLVVKQLLTIFYGFLCNFAVGDDVSHVIISYFVTWDTSPPT